jgi:uncharacterized protein (DUF1778 family)
MAHDSPRIEMPTDSDAESQIARAAAEPSPFAQPDHVRMPAEQFDALLNSLDSPDSAPRLATTAAAQRSFSRD